VTGGCNLEARAITQYSGVPREPVPVPLDRARDLRIRQVMDHDGADAGDLPDPGLSRPEVTALYRHISLLRAIDTQGWKLQRSGRIAFWIPIAGQEASQVGPVAAMHPDDWIFRAHREICPWLMRGAPLVTLFAQFFGSEAEPQRGRRLPVLIGNRRINLVSSTTQVGPFITHAAGAGWAARIMRSPRSVLSFFGDGATSRGEFHSAMNFAGIHRPRTVFVCVNNSWAVTTPLSAQTAMDDFAAKGDAYAVRNLRVDGNDVLAMYSATKQALDGIDDGPTLIEAVTYRLGFHTSSDNPDLYRRPEECSAWERWDPLHRTRRYLEHRGWWNEAEEQELRAQQVAEIQSAVTEAAKLPLPGPESQFDDVFAEPIWMLEEQKKRLLGDLAARGEA